MTAPLSTTEPSTGDGPARPQRTGLLRAAPVVALIGVVMALIGIGLVSRPLSTPTQDCGTALTFLLDGEPNQWVSVDNPPDGITADQAQANNDHPCQERAANQARPAVALIALGTLAALIAAIAEVVARNLGRRRDIRALDGRTLPPSGNRLPSRGDRLPPRT